MSFSVILLLASLGLFLWQYIYRSAYRLRAFIKDKFTPFYFIFINWSTSRWVKRRISVVKNREKTLPSSVNTNIVLLHEGLSIPKFVKSMEDIVMGTERAASRKRKDAGKTEHWCRSVISHPVKGNPGLCLTFFSIMWLSHPLKHFLLHSSQHPTVCFCLLAFLLVLLSCTHSCSIVS